MSLKLSAILALNLSLLSLLAITVIAAVAALDSLIGVTITVLSIALRNYNLKLTVLVA